jgi:hypothetical protein
VVCVLSSPVYRGPDVVGGFTGAISVYWGFSCRLFGMVQAADGVTLLTKVLLLVAHLFSSGTA